MRPIIIDMKELSESEEIYKSSPHKITVIFVYIMLAFTVISVAWLSLFSIDETVDAIGVIRKDKDQTYHMDIYVSGQDYGSLKEGRDVRFEILAYPANEYDYFHGKITKISDEPANVTESVENFYQVTVSINMDELKDADGNALSLAEGLPCRAGIVTGHERMITYCLKRLR